MAKAGLLHSKRDVEKLLNALDGHADRVIATAKEVESAFGQEEFGLYARFRGHCDDFDTLEPIPIT